MSADTMPCGCSSHADNYYDECKYPKLEKSYKALAQLAKDGASQLSLLKLAHVKLELEERRLTTELSREQAQSNQRLCAALREYEDKVKENARLQKQYDDLVPMYEEEKKTREWERKSWEELRNENARLKELLDTAVHLRDKHLQERDSTLRENTRLETELAKWQKDAAKHQTDKVFAVVALADCKHELVEANVRLITALNKQNILTCVYCGHAYPPSTPTHGAPVLTEHIKACAKHPMRAVEAENARLIEDLRIQTGMRQTEAAAAQHYKDENKRLQERLAVVDSELAGLRSQLPQLYQEAGYCPHGCRNICLLCAKEAFESPASKTEVPDR